MDAQTALGHIVKLTPRRAYLLVGIGGHGGSGKSTLARAVPKALVIGTDEFWNGGEFELSRLRRELFDPLLAGRPARFASFDWEQQEPRGTRVVEPTGTIVVEGVCALHRIFRDAYDLRIWVEAPRDVRLARGVARDGEEARQTWEQIWMPGEDRYVERDDPISAADLIVDGTSGIPERAL
jgi:uridine kinase